MITLALVAIVSSAVIVSGVDSIYNVSDASDLNVVKSASINYATAMGTPPTKELKIDKYPDSTVQRIYQALLTKYNGDSSFVIGEFEILEQGELKSRKYLAGTVSDREYVVSLSNPDIVFASPEDVLNDDLNLKEIDKITSLSDMSLEWRDLKDKNNSAEYIDNVNDIYVDGSQVFIAGSGGTPILSFNYATPYDWEMSDVSTELDLDAIDTINYLYKGVKVSIIGEATNGDKVIR